MRKLLLILIVLGIAGLFVVGREGELMLTRSVAAAAKEEDRALLRVEVWLAEPVE